MTPVSISVVIRDRGSPFGEVPISCVHRYVEINGVY